MNSLISSLHPSSVSRLKEQGQVFLALVEAQGEQAPAVVQAARELVEAVTAAQLVQEAEHRLEAKLVKAFRQAWALSHREAP